MTSGETVLIITGAMTFVSGVTARTIGSDAGIRGDPGEPIRDNWPPINRSEGSNRAKNWLCPRSHCWQEFYLFLYVNVTLSEKLGF